LRDNIEPAQVFTRFCFLLGFLDIDDLRELDCSIELIGTSGVTNSGDEGADSTGMFLGSLSDAELAGRDFGEDSPEALSWPKKVHFLADFGVDGPAAELDAMSLSKGIEFRLLGAGLSDDGNVSRSRIGSAVRGRVSAPL
jgi:hypothetical protein